jgi:ubiquinone/menaquinone biosynthesis C-methylase UbiE
MEQNLPMGDILDIHYPDSSFDAYVSMGVIEHFEEGPGQALLEAHRVLKPDGLIFVSVPTVNTLRKVVRRPLRTLINALPMSFKGYSVHLPS